MKRTRKAFTLIELLVVVAIIALLVSILMPALGRAKEMAKRVQCGAHCHDLGIANAIYQNENRGSNPLVGDRNRAESRFGFGHYNTGRLVDTVGRWRAANLPISTIPTFPGTCLYRLVRHADVNPKVFLCPSDDNAEEINLNLAILANPKIEDWDDLNDFQSMLNLS